MAQKEIEITITPDGEISFDLKGFMGKGCSDVSKELIEAFGEVVNQTKKCDYYVSAPSKQKTKTRQY